LGFEAEHLQIALSLCGDSQPVNWLRDNWLNMVDTVVTLATNYGHERPDNNIGTLTREEATRSVLKNQGNIWNSVTECVEERRRKVFFYFIEKCCELQWDYVLISYLV
jgi:E3 ubiquitin-protein ligase RNF31